MLSTVPAISPWPRAAPPPSGLEKRSRPTRKQASVRIGRLRMAADCLPTSSWRQAVSSASRPSAASRQVLHVLTRAVQQHKDLLPPLGLDMLKTHQQSTG